MYRIKISSFELFLLFSVVLISYLYFAKNFIFYEIPKNYINKYYTYSDVSECSKDFALHNLKKSLEKLLGRAVHVYQEVSFTLNLSYKGITCFPASFPKCFSKLEFESGFVKNYFLVKSIF